MSNGHLQIAPDYVPPQKAALATHKFLYVINSFLFLTYDVSDAPILLFYPIL